MPRHLLTDRGETLLLSTDLRRRIGAGGQGQVYRAELHGEAVAVKLLRQVDGRRLRALRNLEERCGDLATLPRRLLHEEGTPSAEPVGYVMRWIDPVRSLAASRLSNFDEISRLSSYSWQQAVLLAQRLAESVAALHRCGVVIGDLNCENVLFTKQGDDWRAVLLDTDSFQLTDADGIRHHCPVSRPPTTAPELIGADLSRTWRSPAADNFALAVLIYQLLLHDHPYDNVVNQLEPDLSVARRIARGLYPHAAVPQPGLSASTYRPTPRQISIVIDRAFRRSFHPSQEHPCPGLRPTAAEWAALLSELHGELVPCGRQPHHHHARGMSCLWCAVDQAVGQPISLFPASSMGSMTPRQLIQGQTTVDPLPQGCDEMAAQLARHRRSCHGLLSLRVRLIDRLLDLAGDAAELESAHGSRSVLIDHKALEVRLRSRDVWWRRLPGHDARQAARNRSLDQLVATADTIATGLATSLRRLRAEQQMLLDRLAGLDTTLLGDHRWAAASGVVADAAAAETVRDLITARKKQWMSEQMERIPIRSWKLEGFGEARLALLERHGLSTSQQMHHNIERITALPGIGHGLQQRLRRHLDDMLRELQRLAEGRTWPIDPAVLIAPDAAALVKRLESEFQALQRQVADQERSLEKLRLALVPQLLERDQQLQSFKRL